MSDSPDPKSVFLNVPFDRAYERLFIALVGTLVFLGLTPRCVLEVRETGDGRLLRIFDLMRTCRTSIHDLSRVGTPARFNMPFELGLACALRLANPAQYDLFVFDGKPFRVDRTLSDYKGRDPLIHHNRIDGMVSCLLDAFQPPSVVAAGALRSALHSLSRSAAALKDDLKVDSLFRPTTFKSLFTIATDIAIERGFIASGL